MVSFAQLFVIAVVVATTNGQILNVTSDAQDYLLLSQRELLHEIEIMDAKINSVDARFADRLDVIQSQQQEILHEIQQVNSTLMPLQALGLVRKHCIQKYDSQLTTYDDAKLILKACYDRAVLTGNTLTSKARTSVDNARGYVINTLPANVAICDKWYPNNQTDLEQCYINHVETAKTAVKIYLNAARIQRDRALYDASKSTKTAVQCSFIVEKDTLETIGQTSRAIDDCEVSLKKLNNAVALSNPERKSVQNLFMGKDPYSNLRKLNL